MNITEQFRVEWDRLFTHALGESVTNPVLGGTKIVLERGLRETTSGLRRQYRFLFGTGEFERFDWVDEEQLALGRAKKEG